jgi:hypothetical protein
MAVLIDDTESATSLTIFIAAHKPVYRDNATAWRPSSRISCASEGTNVGIPTAASTGIESYGMSDDFAAGSSPTQATTPPRALVPAYCA